MAYYIKRADPDALPLFNATTFLAIVKWCVKAHNLGLLQHSNYEIHGAERKKDRPELVCLFDLENECVLNTAQIE